jgi:MFS family permease
MLRLLANRTFLYLFVAHLCALLGTGLLTVALALLAWKIAGPEAGVVLGTALAIKMLAYVGLAPIAAAFAESLPRRRLLISLDLVRAGMALMLPYVTEVWQVYGLIFCLQAASAGFTPVFQAAIPEILPAERDYTKALAWFRLAYDLESLLSPALAAALLAVAGASILFAGTALGFLASSALIWASALGNPVRSVPMRRLWERIGSGLSLYLASPRLRGLLALNLAVAAAGAMVIVNTVVIVQATLGLGESHVALALGAFGGGSMLAALTLPPVLERLSDRSVMLGGAALLVVGLALAPFLLELRFAALLLLWVILGFGYAAVQTPSGRLLRRSSMPEDRPALFAAQFSLSHLCWLLTYPLAGKLGAQIGLSKTFFVFALIALASVTLALRLWPKRMEVLILHRHPELPPDHPHLLEYGGNSNHRHPPMGGSHVQ